LRLEFEFELASAFLMNLCENNEHQKLAYNMGGKFELPAGKQKNWLTRNP